MCVCVHATLLTSIRLTVSNERRDSGYCKWPPHSQALTRQLRVVASWEVTGAGEGVTCGELNDHDVTAWHDGHAIGHDPAAKPQFVDAGTAVINLENINPLYLALIICLWVQWTRQDFKSCYFQNNSTDFIDILWLCYKTKYTTPDKVSDSLAVYEESYQKFSIWVHWTRMSFLHGEIFWKLSILKFKCANVLQDVHCDVIDR